MIDTEDAVGSVASVAQNVFPQLKVRYSDGYKAAKAIVGFGNSVKRIGTIVSVILAIGFFGIASDLHIGGSIGPILVGPVFGGLVWLGFFVCGVIICAQGQLLLATLDSAVNNSPFLDNPQRASIMSL